MSLVEFGSCACPRQFLLPGGGGGEAPIGHTPFLEPGVETTLPKPHGPRAMEAWFCPKLKQSANPQRRSNRGWKAKMTTSRVHHGPPLRTRHLASCWGGDSERDRPCPGPRGADVLVGGTKKKQTNVLKITNCNKFYERHRCWTEIENTLNWAVREGMTFKLR